MITESKITLTKESKQIEYTNVVNKAQRYASLRRFIAIYSRKDAQPMIDAERLKDYSAEDEIELVRLDASDPDQTAK